MGNSDSFQKKKNNLLKNINKAIIYDLTNKTKEYISEEIGSTNFKDEASIQNLENNILINLEQFYKDKYEEIIQLIKNEENPSDNIKTKSEDKNKKNTILQDNKEVKTNSNDKKFDTFTSSDIQTKNKEITIEFMKFSPNFINDEDENENQTLGMQLIRIANISRRSYNDSNKLLEFVYKYFEKEIYKDIIISSPEQIRKNFSSLVKKSKDDTIVINFVDNLLKKLDLPFIINEKNKEIKSYFINLYRKLLILYFQCELSFPSVKINFLNKEEDFNSKKMIDTFQIGGIKYKPKVNFVYFPSLCSNGIFLENGKQWVFNYILTNKKKTFYKENIKLIPLLDEKDKFYIPEISEKLKLSFKKQILYTPFFNYNISNKINKDFIFHIMDKNTGKKNKIKSNSSLKLEENEEIIGYEFYLFNECIISSPNHNNK